MGFGAVHVNNPDKSRWKSTTVSTNVYTECSWYTYFGVSSVPSSLTIGSPIHVLSGVDTDHYGVVNHIDGTNIYVWWADGNKAPESYSGSVDYSEKGYYPVDFPAIFDVNKWSLVVWDVHKFYTLQYGGTRIETTEAIKPVGIFDLHITFCRISHQNPYWPCIYDYTSGSDLEFYNLDVERYFPEGQATYPTVPSHIDRHITSNVGREVYRGKAVTVASIYQFTGSVYYGLKFMPKFEAAA